jgi:hypothetical protein
MPTPTASILDSFTRANENPLSGGGNWSDSLNGSHGNLQLVSNAVKTALGGSGTATAWWNAANFGPDCEASLKISTKPTITAHEVFLFARIQGEGTATYDGYFFRMINQSGTDTWEITRVDNGTGTVLASGSQEYSSGDSFAIQCIGSIISAWYKPAAGSWTLLGAVRDTTYAAAGKIAIGVPDTTVVVDDFAAQTLVSAVAEVDDTAPPTAGVLDDFNRANENPVSQGGNWTCPFISNAASPNIKVVSNQLAADSTTATSDGYRNNIAYGPDCEAFATVAVRAGSGNGMSVFARGQQPGTSTGDAYEVIATQQTGVDNWEIRRLDNGAATQLILFNQEFATGDAIGIKCIGNYIAAWWKNAGTWQLLGYVQDTTYPNAGFLGARIKINTGRLDDFSGGGSIVYLDSSTEIFALTPSGSDTPAIGDGATEPFALTASGIDITNQDIGTEDFKLTASGADAADIHDAATESLFLQPIGADDPQYGLIETGTELFKFSPTALEVKAKEYQDTGTERLVMTITSHECYSRPTPKYEVDVEKRWNMGTPFATWAIETIGTRWVTNIVAIGNEIPC